MEHLTEDGDVVLAGRKANQQFPCLERAQHLLVKQAAWFHSIARHPSHSAVSQLTGCLTARTEHGVLQGNVQNAIPLQDEALHLWATAQRS